MFRRVSDRVVGAAYCVLNFADRAVDLAVALQFGVADRFADRDFRGAFDLFGRSVEFCPCPWGMRSCLFYTMREPSWSRLSYGVRRLTLGVKFAARQRRELLKTRASRTRCVSGIAQFCRREPSGE